MTQKQREPTSAAAPLQHSGPPRMTAASPDAELLEAVRRNVNLLRSVYNEAEQAHNRLCQNPHFPAADFGVATFWMQESWRYRRALPRTAPGVAVDHAAVEAATLAALRIILDARDSLCGLLADLPMLTHGDLLALRGQVQNAETLLAGTRERCPGLASWQDRRRVAGEAAQALQDDVSARQAAASAAAARADQEAAARELVRRLARGGVILMADARGISAQPAALLTAADRAAIAEAKPLLAEILAEVATF